MYVYKIILGNNTVHQVVSFLLKIPYFILK